MTFPRTVRGVGKGRGGGGREGVGAARGGRYGGCHEWAEGYGVAIEGYRGGDREWEEGCEVASEVDESRDARRRVGLREERDMKKI